MTALALRDQIFIRIDVPDDVDGMALGDIARVVTLILEITIAVLVILAKIAVVSWFVGRGILDVWLRLALVNPLVLIANRALGYGRYWQG